jgi:hypothetical protein
LLPCAPSCEKIVLEKFINFVGNGHSPSAQGRKNWQHTIELMYAVHILEDIAGRDPSFVGLGSQYSDFLPFQSASGSVGASQMESGRFQFHSSGRRFFFSSRRFFFSSRRFFLPVVDSFWGGGGIAPKVLKT